MNNSLVRSIARGRKSIFDNDQVLYLLNKVLSCHSQNQRWYISFEVIDPFTILTTLSTNSLNKSVGRWCPSPQLQHLSQPMAYLTPAWSDETERLHWGIPWKCRAELPSQSLPSGVLGGEGLYDPCDRGTGEWKTSFQPCRWPWVVWFVRANGKRWYGGEKLLAGLWRVTGFRVTGFIHSKA